MARITDMQRAASVQNQSMTRRGLFQQVGSALYAAALTQLLSRDLYGADSSGQRSIYDLKPRRPEHSPKAKSVIHLFMNGGPSQMDLFDPKKELDKRHGEDFFNKIAGEVEFPDAAGALMRSPFRFAQRGRVRHVGVGCVAALRNTGRQRVADPFDALDQPDSRARAVQDSFGQRVHRSTFARQLGCLRFGNRESGTCRPTSCSMIHWVYPSADRQLDIGLSPPLYQGTRFRATGAPVLDLKPDFDEPESITRLERDLIARLDQLHQSQRPEHPQLAARISSYELAARMQIEASDALDLRYENEATFKMYGIDQPVTESYGRRCPDRPSADRARGTLRPVVYQRSDLGHPQQHWHGTQRGCDRTGQTNRRLVAGPQTTGAPRRDAGAVGW